MWRIKKPYPGTSPSDLKATEQMPTTQPHEQLLFHQQGAKTRGNGLDLNKSSCLIQVWGTGGFPDLRVAKPQCITESSSGKGGRLSKRRPIANFLWSSVSGTQGKGGCVGVGRDEVEEGQGNTPRRQSACVSDFLSTGTLLGNLPSIIIVKVWPCLFFCFVFNFCCCCRVLF